MTSCLNKTDGDLTATQSLQLTQQCLLSIFSSIAYIREFFEDGVYEDWSFGVGDQQMRAKRLRRGAHRQSDRLLDWIERGCYDAIQKQYLKTAMLGIYEPERKGEGAMLESYTFHLCYPNRSGGGEMPMMLKIQSQGQSKEIPLNNRDSFRYQLARLMRSVCMMAQRLDPLPARRHLTMHLEYYEDATPSNYQPPGFHSALFEPICLFDEPVMRHDFGMALSPYHRMQLSMATTKGSSFLDDDKDKGEKVPDAAVAKSPVKHKSPVRRPAEVTPKQVIAPKPVPEEQPKTPMAKVPQVELSKKLKQVKLQETQTPLLSSPSSGEAVDQTQQIWCACGDAQEGEDMIQCDKCNRWQHTACAGFSSSRDTRLTNKNLAYECYGCRFFTKLPHPGRCLLKTICRKRRIISLIYTGGEGGGVTPVQAGRSLNCCYKSAKSLLTDLEKDGYLMHEDNLYRRTGDEEAKRRMIREYFTIDPRDMPRFAFFLKDSKSNLASKDSKTSGSAKAEKPVKRFKSIPDFSVHDDHE